MGNIVVYDVLLFTVSSVRQSVVIPYVNMSDKSGRSLYHCGRVDLQANCWKEAHVKNYSS